MKLILSLLLASIGAWVVDPSTQFSSPPASPVAGIFEGRSPCQELAKELNLPLPNDCFKLKWYLTLYQDATTHEPTTYVLEGTPYRKAPLQGKWSIVTTTKDHKNTIIYQLDTDKPGISLLLQKGDDNVLFFLGSNKNLLVGNADFSYTLNRVVE
jgi:hypothetical protein